MNTTIDTLDGLLLRDVKWKVKTAGPSPYDNERTELFLLGCKKAMQGNPCKGCFNSSTWDNSKAEFSHDPILMAKHINNTAPNKYITIGGGEPTDQIDNLIILCKELKKFDFHIMVYTHLELKKFFKKGLVFNSSMSEGNILRNKLRTLIDCVDIIIDGEYRQEERLWDESKEDGLLSSVGSGNQIVWNTKYRYGFYMRDIKAIWLDQKNKNNLCYEMHQSNIEPLKIEV